MENQEFSLSQLSDFPELKSPIAFAEYISIGRWKSAPHFELINSKLLQILDGGTNKMIVNLPPRHGKSELISFYFLVWYSFIYPYNNLIFVSYNQGIAKYFGNKVINLIEEKGSKYGVILNKRSKSSKEFVIDKYGGTYSFTGIGGTLTGKGANLIVIDDPIKNNQDAFSKTKRENLWDWYQSTLFTRLEPNSKLLLVMTRWHQDDICGRLLEKMEKQPQSWDLLKLPILAKENDLLNRKSGQLLWEGRFELSEILERKETLGDFWFSALYQQEPNISNGEIFKKQYFRYFEIEFIEEKKYLILNKSSINQRVIKLDDCKIFVTMDLAISTKTKADWTVLLVFAVTKDNDIMILDIIREKVEPIEHINLIQQCYNKYKPILIGIEKVQYQTSLIKEGLKIGLPIMELIPNGEKWVRALPMGARMQSEKVYFLNTAKWLASFEDELMSFPNGNHDDQVDAFSYISQIIDPSRQLFENRISKVRKQKISDINGFG